MRRLFSAVPVSYTHLDVYKRQLHIRTIDSRIGSRVGTQGLENTRQRSARSVRNDSDGTPARRPAGNSLANLSSAQRRRTHPANKPPDRFTARTTHIFA